MSAVLPLKYFMDNKSKNRLGAIAIKYNVGRDTIVDALIENGFSDVHSNLGFILSEEQINYIDKLFSESLVAKQIMKESLNKHITNQIVDVLIRLVDLLKLNEKLSILSYHQFPWKESEILSLANKYINSLPIDILENIKTKKLIQKELLDEIYFYLSKPDLSKKIKIKKKGYGGDFNSTYVNDFDRDDIIEDGPYCSACESAPCMCSDRERTSTTFDF